MGDYGLLMGDFSLRVVDLADPACSSPSVVQPQSRRLPTGLLFPGSYVMLTQQAILDPNLNRLAGGGLAIFDVSDPLTLTQTGFFATSNGYGLGPVAVSGRYVYAVDIFSINDTRPMDTLYIIDVANPAAPVQVGSYKAPGWIVDMAVQGQHMYLITVNDELLVLSLANPVQPVMVGFWE